MSVRDDRQPTPGRVAGAPRSTTPTGALGWWGIGLAGAALVSWTALPVIGALVFGEEKSGGFMLAAMVLAVVAAVFNVLCVSAFRQRSALNIVAAALTVPNAVIALAEAVSMLAGRT